MSRHWVEHTAEVELHIEAASEEDVFAQALAALGELIDDRGGGESVAREVSVAAGDRGALLAAWLDELVYLAETEDFVPETARRLQLESGRLRATVLGHVGRPRHLVKGATYHGLELERTGEGFEAKVVLDV